MSLDPVLFHLFIATLSLVVVIDAVLSWILPNTNRLPRSFTAPIAGPLCTPFRKLFPPERFGGLEVSHLFAFATLNLVARLLPLGA